MIKDLFGIRVIVCDKRFIWNPSNCECECDKSSDIGKYLDYQNCKCRKRLVDKLAEECCENIDENKMTNLTLNNVCGSCKRSFCIIYIVLFLVFLTITIGTDTVFLLLLVHIK